MCIRDRLKTGDKLPSEQALMEHYCVSRRTVRTAVDELRGQGCLVRKQGKGTFVSRPKQMCIRDRFIDFEPLRRRGLLKKQEYAGLSFGKKMCIRDRG